LCFLKPKSDCKMQTASEIRVHFRVHSGKYPALAEIALDGLPQD
jgi:hypothetical protein